MSGRYGSLQGNSMGLSAVPLNDVEHCKARIARLQAKRDREVQPGQSWEYDGAIEHAKQELAVAIKREQSASR